MEKETPLYAEHVEAGARMVPFAGFLMPLQYSSIIEEHRAVREGMGMFDLSHMGELRVSGPDAAAAVDYLVTNDIAGLEPGQIRYTPMCYPDGGIVDDLLVYRFPDHLMLIVNASNIEKDLAWVRDHLRGDATVENESDATALIAVQGPRSVPFVQDHTDTDLAPIAYYHFTQGTVAGRPAVISRTGYTGEDGVELYVAPQDAAPVWETLLAAGEALGLKRVGLGARDTLRLEAGYMLYGNDIDHSTSPLEAGLGWTVKLEKDFIARDVLERQKEEGVQRRMVQLEMLDRAIPRPHFAIWQGPGDVVGSTTSGTMSPTFNRGIALGYVARGAAKAGTDVDVEVRGARHPARIVKKPLYKREAS